MKNSWFKHYNNAHEGQLIGDLIVSGKHEAALLVYVIMEMISRYETELERGKASVPIERIARAMNMKPSKIDRLIAEIRSVSRSDLICETPTEQPRNRSFLMRNWLKLQETRGGKRLAKTEQKPARSKKAEDRSKNTPIVPLSGDGVCVGSEKGNIPVQSDYDRLVQIWNSSVKNLPKIKTISKSRLKKLSARWKECSDLESWRSAIQLLDSSDWSNGKSDRGWVADFDYLIRPEKFISLIEKSQQGKQTKPKQKTQFELPAEFLKNDDATS